MRLSVPFSALAASPEIQAGVSEMLKASGAYDLPAGFMFDEASQTIFRNVGTAKKPRWEKDDFRTAKLRAAVATEKMQAANLEARNRVQSQINEVAAYNLQMAEEGRRQAEAHRQEIMNQNAARSLTGGMYSPVAVAPRGSYYEQPEPAPVYSAPAVYAAPLSTLPAPVPPPVAPVQPDPVELARRQQAALMVEAARLVRAYGPVPAQARAYASQLAASGRSAEAGPWLDYAGRLENWLREISTTYNVS